MHDTNPTTRPLWIVSGVALVVAVLLILLPPTLQRLLFVLIVAGGLGVAGIRLFGLLHATGKSILELYHIHQNRVAQVSAGVMLALLGLSAWFYQPLYITQHYGFYLFAISLPFAWLARSLFAYPTPDNISSENAKSHIRPLAIIIGVLAFCLLMTINMPQHFKSEIHHLLGLMLMPVGTQVLIVGVGLVALVIGFGGNPFPYPFKWQRHHSILLGLVLFGGFLRAWNLEYNLQFFVDTYAFAEDVVLVRDTTQQLLFPQRHVTTFMYPFFQHVFVSLFGASLTSFRLTTVIVTTGGLVVVYALVLHLLTVRVALLSVLLAAVLPVHIFFNRTALVNNIDPIIGMLGFVYLIRGMKSGRLGDFALAGVVFGMTHYFYVGGRLFMTLFLIGWIVWMLTVGRRDPIFRIPSWRHGLVLLFCLLIVTLPPYHMRFQYDFTITGRLDSTANPEVSQVNDPTQLIPDDVVGMLGTPLNRYIRDIAFDTFYRDTYAYVLPILTPFFLLGFVILVMQIRRSHGALFIWYIVGIVVGNSLVSDQLSQPNPRYTIVYAMLMIIVAVGVDRLWHLLETKFEVRRRLIRLVFVLYLVFTSAFLVNHYFNSIIAEYSEYVFTRIDARTNLLKLALDDFLFRAVELPPDTTVVLFSGLPFPDTHAYVLPAFYGRDIDEFQIIVTDPESLPLDYFAGLQDDTNYVFAFKPRYQQLVLHLMRDHFRLDNIEDSPYDIPDKVELMFAHVTPIDAESAGGD